MAEGHVCEGILPNFVLKFEARKCHFLHSEAHSEARSEHPNLL